MGTFRMSMGGCHHDTARFTLSVYDDLFRNIDISGPLCHSISNGDISITVYIYILHLVGTLPLCTNIHTPESLVLSSIFANETPVDVCRRWSCSRVYTHDTTDTNRSRLRRDGD